MRLRRDHLASRLCGALIGVGFAALGTFAIAARSDFVSGADAERALWYGVTLIVVGVLAVFASWTATDLDRIWCRQPRRWDSRRADDP